MRDIINITMGELTTAFDNEVVKAVQKVGIDVNKEELLKAIELYHSLVRCGECKYDGTWKCPWRNTQVTRYPSANDFCSYGCRSEKPNNSERSSE